MKGCHGLQAFTTNIKTCLSRDTPKLQLIEQGNITTKEKAPMQFPGEIMHGASPSTVRI